MEVERDGREEREINSEEKVGEKVRDMEMARAREKERVIWRVICRGRGSGSGRGKGKWRGEGWGEGIMWSRGERKGELERERGGRGGREMEDGKGSGRLRGKGKETVRGWEIEKRGEP